jgi:general secretion pathway protein G
MKQPDLQQTTSGAIKAGWACLILGLVLMLIPFPLFYIFGPLCGVAFILAIVGLAKGQTGKGIILLISSLVLPPMCWFIGLAILGSTLMSFGGTEGTRGKARYGAALAQMRILEDALKRYKLDNGVFPTSEQGLQALVRRPSVGVIPQNWPEGGYLDKQEVPKDAWGNAYIYIAPGQHSPNYDLKSLGADSREGGEGDNADIESWRVPR